MRNRTGKTQPEHDIAEKLGHDAIANNANNDQQHGAGQSVLSREEQQTLDGELAEQAGVSVAEEEKYNKDQVDYRRKKKLVRSFRAYPTREESSLAEPLRRPRCWPVRSTVWQDRQILGDGSEEDSKARTSLSTATN